MMALLLPTAYPMVHPLVVEQEGSELLMLRMVQVSLLLVSLALVELVAWVGPMAGLILKGHKNSEHPHSRPHFGIVNSSTYLERTHFSGFSSIKKFSQGMKTTFSILYLFIFELSVVRGVGRLI